MGHGIRNILVIICIGLIAVAVGAGLIRYYALDFVLAAVAGVTTFSALLVIHNNISLQRHYSRVERQLRGYHQFEENIGGRLRLLESSGNKPKSSVPGQSTVASLPSEPGLLRELSANTNERERGVGEKTNGSSENHNETRSNIIALNSKMERINSVDRVPAKTFKIKPSQLSKALDKGGTELFLQPVMELPSQNIRYFEAFVRLRIGDNILTAKQFLPAAKDAGQIASIDLLSLGLTFKVVRGLQRQNNEYPVFWNISPQTLGNKRIFKELLEQLRANQPLNQQLICEISHTAFTSLNTVQSGNLAKIRDLGFELSLDQVSSQDSVRANVENIIKSGLFSILKIPAIDLMRIGENEIVNFASHIVPIAAKSNLTIIASDIESDAQSVAMIDSDIFLAQGDALMPAKALKKELGGV